jgi:hypothetical protein
VSRIASGGMVKLAGATSESAQLMMTCAITTGASAVTSAMRRGHRGTLADRAARHHGAHHGAVGARAHPLARAAAPRATRATLARRRRHHADERRPRDCSTVSVEVSKSRQS